jgi:hypothetical protein
MPIHWEAAVPEIVSRARLAPARQADRRQECLA